MSGFFDDLERQLVQAARQRAPGSHRPSGRRMVRPLLTGAVVAAVAATPIALVLGLGGGDEDAGRAVRQPEPPADALQACRPPNMRSKACLEALRPAASATTTRLSSASGVLRGVPIALLREEAGSDGRQAGTVTVVAPPPVPQSNGRPAQPRPGQRALDIRATGIRPPGRRYAVWLARKNPVFLGFAPPVTRTGKLVGLAGIPREGLAGVRQILVTREVVDQPTRPGQVVLRGMVPQLARPKRTTAITQHTGQLPDGTRYIVQAEQVARGPAKVCLKISVDKVGSSEGCGAAPVVGKPGAALRKVSGGGYVAYGILPRGDKATQVRVTGAKETASVRTSAAPYGTWAVFTPLNCSPLVVFEDRSGREVGRDQTVNRDVSGPKPRGSEPCPVGTP